VSETAWCSPSGDSDGDAGAWSSPGNAYASDDAYAYASYVSSNWIWLNYLDGATSLYNSIPSGATIDGIKVAIEGYAGGELLFNGDKVTMKAEVSVDGGAHWSTAKSLEFYVDQGEITVEAGGATDKWGLTLTRTSFSDANFMVRITYYSYTGGAQTISVDWIPAKVYYSTGAVAACRLPLLGVG
jgi:hypothetical protein